MSRIFADALRDSSQGNFRFTRLLRHLPLPIRSSFRPFSNSLTSPLHLRLLHAKFTSSSLFVDLANTSQSILNPSHLLPHPSTFVRLVSRSVKFQLRDTLGLQLLLHSLKHQLQLSQNLRLSLFLDPIRPHSLFNTRLSLPLREKSPLSTCQKHCSKRSHHFSIYRNETRRSSSFPETSLNTSRQI